mmetsp:Transcript_9852/g.23816  ORF Transcript_9852/g.23816 Transcript_9852/m.23816 type:complete len:164 (-) Transcript_9852:491-982(-)
MPHNRLGNSTQSALAPGHHRGAVAPHFPQLIGKAHADEPHRLALPAVVPTELPSECAAVAGGGVGFGSAGGLPEPADEPRELLALSVSPVATSFSFSTLCTAAAAALMLIPPDAPVIPSLGNDGAGTALIARLVRPSGGAGLLPIGFITPTRKLFDDAPKSWL